MEQRRTNLEKETNSIIEPWYSVEEIAEHLGISKETVYRWLDRKIIPAHRMGKLWKFKPTEVDRWVLNGGAAVDQVEPAHQGEDLGTR